MGLNPTIPLYAAGLKTEPAVCDPKAIGKNPAATPAAEPLLDPPGVLPRFQGFFVNGGSPQANWVVTVFPIIICLLYTSDAADE